MARFIKSRTNVTGLAPGSLVLLGNKKMEETHLRVMNYTADNLEEYDITNINECIPLLEEDSVTWINIYGIHDVELIGEIGRIFNIDILFLEDLLNTDQPPKYENGDTYDGFILKMLAIEEVTGKLQSEQITLVLGEKYVLTLQEVRGDILNPVRERIRNHKGRVRLNNNDYLAYALLDTLVDKYLGVIESIGIQIEEVEPKIFEENGFDIAQIIYTNKTELSYLRKNIRPLKDIMKMIMKSEDTFFKKATSNYLKDLNELVIQASDVIELYAGVVSDQLNTYSTIVNNRMNKIMKVLTIFASTFIPLSFIAGIYGMNFEYIPELRLKYGYFLFWGIILVVGGSLLLFFKHKKWL